mmetsp:Transcript_5504/g.13294  ORF Transcript_5504/g.13294 Transcript_5504/m.13294 type:complete len:89 (+) Transcript_5504:448-714(+)
MSTRKISLGKRSKIFERLFNTSNTLTRLGLLAPDSFLILAGKIKVHVRKNSNWLVFLENTYHWCLKSKISSHFFLAFSEAPLERKSTK